MNPPQSLKLAALTLCSFAAQADQVLLKNGDIISGTVLSKSGSVLEMKTDYAEKVVIKWDAIETLKSDIPMTVILKDKQELTGLAGTGQNGTMTLDSNGVYKTQPIPLTDIKEINKKFFTGSTNFGGGLSAGNTERQAYHADANVQLRGRDDKVTLGGQYNYADDTSTNATTNQKETDLSARNWQLFGTYGHFFTDKWYAYANGLFTNDRFQDIKLRSVFGVGAGYQFFESEDLNLSFEAGPAYENVDYFDYGLDCSATNPCERLDDKSGMAGRWALNYDQFVFSRTVQLFHFHEGVVSSGVFIRSRTGFNVPIWNGLQFTNQVQVDYNSDPATGTEPTDVRYLFSAGYGW